MIPNRSSNTLPPRLGNRIGRLMADPRLAPPGHPGYENFRSSCGGWHGHSEVAGDVSWRHSAGKQLFDHLILLSVICCLRPLFRPSWPAISSPDRVRSMVSSRFMPASTMAKRVTPSPELYSFAASEKSETAASSGSAIARAASLSSQPPSRSGTPCTSKGRSKPQLGMVRPSTLSYSNSSRHSAGSTSTLPATINGRAPGSHKANSGRSEHRTILNVLYCPFSEGTQRWPTKMRNGDEMPPPAGLNTSPYDPEARYSTKRGSSWVGYKGALHRELRHRGATPDHQHRDHAGHDTGR